MGFKREQTMEMRDNHELMKRISRNMTKARIASGKTKADVAIDLGATRQAINQWETGSYVPRLGNLVDYAAAVGCDPGDLLREVTKNLPAGSGIKKRLAASAQAIPLYGINTVGAILMQAVKAEPSRYVAAITKCQSNAVAFEIADNAMLRKFHPGDVVVINPADMAEPEQCVLAMAGGNVVFRQFFPKNHGAVIGGQLRAMNGSYPAIALGKHDKILGVMAQHVTTRHD